MTYTRAMQYTAGCPANDFEPEEHQASDVKAPLDFEKSMLSLKVHFSFYCK